MTYPFPHKKVTVMIGHDGKKLHPGLARLNDAGEVIKVLNLCSCAHRIGQHISYIEDGTENANCRI